MDVRPYTPADRESCLRIFDSHVPASLPAAARTTLSQFLDQLSPPHQYFLLEHDSALVGCGGFLPLPERASAELTWGIIRADLQRNGLGRFLLMYRLRAIGNLPDAAITQVTLHTTPHAAPFFLQQGFRALHSIPDAFAPGLARVTLLKKLAVCS